MARHTGQPVRIIGCEAGACSAGLGQNLSNKLGVTVEAPTDLAYIDYSGTAWTTGYWRVFTPRTGGN